MKYFYILLIGIFLGSAGFSQERILSYDSHITIEKNGSLLVREEITVEALGIEITRGIYRSFPTTYKDRMGTRYKVGFEVIEILKDGRSEPWFLEKGANGEIVYIGDREKMLENGQYTYTITYRTTRQIGFFKDHDELYFNAIGGDWTFNIEKSSVTIELPGGATPMETAAYSGPVGSTTCKCTIETAGSTVKIASTGTFDPHNQLTFVVAWPKGYVDEPTLLQKITFFLKNNLFVLVALLGLGLAATMYYRAWKKVGVDPPKGTIIPLFDPPEGFTPADTAYLKKMAMSNEAFTAAIVNMAIKGFLKINNEKRSYSLERLTNDTSLLSPEEQAFASALFSNGDVIELKNTNHSAFTKAKSRGEQTLDKKLSPKYLKHNTYKLIPGIVISLIFAVLSFFISPNVVIPFIFSVLLFLIFVLFLWLIKAPTKEGRAVMDEIEGFKMYVNVAEKQRLNLVHEPGMTIERFEKLLPFAIALGVENKWSQKFENAISKALTEVKEYNPAWYVGARSAQFSPSQFSSAIGSKFSSAISSASTPPGSSSGGGGGGFSGGGGGGGGGGGW